MAIKRLLSFLFKEIYYCLPVSIAHLVPALFFSVTVHPVNNLPPFFCRKLVRVRYGMAHRAEPDDVEYLGVSM